MQSSRNKTKQWQPLPRVLFEKLAWQNVWSTDKNRQNVWSTEIGGRFQDAELNWLSEMCGAKQRNGSRYQEHKSCLWHAGLAECVEHKKTIGGRYQECKWRCHRPAGLAEGVEHKKTDGGRYQGYEWRWLGRMCGAKLCPINRRCIVICVCEACTRRRTANWEQTHVNSHLPQGRTSPASELDKG